MDSKPKIVPHNKIYNDLPPWTGSGNDYLREYQKKNWYCQTCNKNCTISNKYRHQKTPYHLKRCVN